jgi:hypothetical protein
LKIKSDYHKGRLTKAEESERTLSTPSEPGGAWNVYHSSDRARQDVKMKMLFGKAIQFIRRMLMLQYEGF